MAVTVVSGEVSGAGGLLAAASVIPDSEICLKRLTDYETLNGNSHRAEHYRQQLEQLSGDSRK